MLWGLTCSPCRATSSTRRKVSARCTFAAVRACVSCCLVGITREDSGQGPRMSRESLAQDAERISALRDTLEQGLLERVPHSRVNGGGAPRTPNTANILFPGLEGEALVIALDLKGLACSNGAACSSGAVEPSHVLTAIGLLPEEARASLRFSLGRHTTSTDIDFALSVVPAAVAQLRELSPTYQKAVAHE